MTPGVQITAFSPVGPIRFVVGYNPYNRPAGPIYYEVPSNAEFDELGTAAGSLPCVSPDNKLPVNLSDNDGLIQNSGLCNPSFIPRTNRSFVSRLTFSLAIGQAF